MQYSDGAFTALRRESFRSDIQNEWIEQTAEWFTVKRHARLCVLLTSQCTCWFTRFSTSCKTAFWFILVFPFHLSLFSVPEHRGVDFWAHVKYYISYCILAKSVSCKNMLFVVNKQIRFGLSRRPFQIKWLKQCLKFDKKFRPQLDLPVHLVEYFKRN